MLVGASVGKPVGLWVGSKVVGLNVDVGIELGTMV